MSLYVPVDLSGEGLLQAVYGILSEPSVLMSSPTPIGYGDSAGQGRTRVATGTGLEARLVTLEARGGQARTATLPINGFSSHTDEHYGVSNGIPRIASSKSWGRTNRRPDLIEGSFPDLIQRRKVLVLQRACAAASSRVRYGPGSS